MKNKTIVSEYVSYGHPDKLADQIADAILDGILKEDENARTGIEVMVKDNNVILGGEINTTADIDYEYIVKQVFEHVNYPKNHHLQTKDIKVINLIGQQSIEIHRGVDKTDGDIGAGDQGFMVGYASNETDNFMPLGHYLAKKICDYVVQMDNLGPDAKTQVIVHYDNEGKAEVKNILISTMHQNGLEFMRKFLKSDIKFNSMHLDKKIFDKYILNKDIQIDINPCGEWRIGGPISDAGVTGRKIVVDAYGGYANVGGGAYSGKDMTKVDRSAAYAARHIAKNIVAANIADEAKVTLSYMIGVPEPCSIDIELNRNEDKIPLIKKWISKNLSLTPNNIIKRFKPVVPNYYYLARNGHYGLNKTETLYDCMNVYPWECLDVCDSLKALLIQQIK